MKVVRARAPGRVNLLGEHTDYNDGLVLPCAIAYETTVRAQERADGVVAAQSENGSTAACKLSELPNAAHGDWSDYLWGVLAELQRRGVPVSGCDVQVSGNVPIGAGLSSSASLEVAFALAMLALSGTAPAAMDVALLAQRAEIDFVGTRCGIMDQFTVLFGRAGHALFIDTRSLHYRAIPVPDEAAIVICNTMVKHNLASGEYNERRLQCEQAVAILQQRYPHVRALRDATPEMLQQTASLPQQLRARVRHVISENARVEKAVAALESGDVSNVGGLMYESHLSLRDDYQVSCVELDTMVEIARSFPGILGARMTGGGFGGCTVNLLPAAKAGEFGEYMQERYRESTGITPDIYDGTPSDGARLLHE